MAIKIGDKVTVYDKDWLVNNISDAVTVKSVYPEIGQRMEELDLKLLSLEAAVPETLDLVIMRIHGHRSTSTVFLDKNENFRDPDETMPELAKSVE